VERNTFHILLYIHTSVTSISARHPKGRGTQRPTPQNADDPSV
jgi:hypothetical protein